MPFLGFPGGPVVGTPVRSLAQEDPTCCRATKPTQLLLLRALAPVLCNRSPCSEKPEHCTQIVAPTLQLGKALEQQRRPSPAKNK